MRGYTSRQLNTRRLILILFCVAVSVLLVTSLSTSLLSTGPTDTVPQSHSLDTAWNDTHAIPFTSDFSQDSDHDKQATLPITMAAIALALAFLLSCDSSNVATNFCKTNPVSLNVKINS